MKENEIKKKIETNYKSELVNKIKWKGKKKRKRRTKNGNENEK